MLLIISAKRLTRSNFSSSNFCGQTPHLGYWGNFHLHIHFQERKIDEDEQDELESGYRKDTPRNDAFDNLKVELWVKGSLVYGLPFSFSKVLERATLSRNENDEMPNYRLAVARIIKRVGEGEELLDELSRERFLYEVFFRACQ